MKSARERRLFGATVFSGVLVLFAHTGGPTSCSARQITVRNVGELYDRVSAEVPGVTPGLTLRHGSETTKLAAGTLIELNGETDRFVSIVGYHEVSGDLFVSEGGNNIAIVPGSHITSITVVGGSRTGAGAGNGALVGGVTGAVVGGALVAGSGSGELVPVCAIGFGGLGAGTGAGVGAGIGAGAGRVRTEYPIGPGKEQWQLGSAPPAPAKPSASPGAP